MNRSGHIRRLAAALALSAALHAGLAAMLSAGGRPAAPAEERVEVRLVEVAEAVQAPAPPQSGGATARRGARPALASTPASTPTSTSTPTATPTATSTATSTSTSTESSRGSAAWLAERGLAPAEGSGISLSLPWRAGGAAERAAPAAGGPATTGAEAKQIVDGWFRELAAAEKAGRQPDGYWSGMKQRLAQGFSPGWEILTGTRQEVGLFSRGQLRALAEAWKGYQEQAARYGATGNAFGSDEGAPGARRTLADDVRDLRLAPGDGLPAAARPESRLFHRELVTLVRIRQAPDGRVAGVELARSSGNADHDHRALERAQALREEAEPSLGPTPPQGRETLWAFATSFDMVPPVPVLGLSFDAWFRPDDVTWPLKKSARSSVELRAVY